MKFERFYTKSNIHVEQQIKWKTCNAKITDSKGKTIFEMNQIEVPEQWSQTAVNIIAQKYFRKAGVANHFNTIPEENIPQWLQRSEEAWNQYDEIGSETSAKQVFHRLAGCWTYWGWKEGFFKEDPDDMCGQKESYAHVFYDELYYMLAMQIAAPNSPQWFNTGLHWAYGIEGEDSGQWTIDYDSHPHHSNLTQNDGITPLPPPAVRIYNSYERCQPHACFIQPVSDDLVNPGGIMDLWIREARLFKHGSGTGSNFSKIRGKNELLSGGGKSSGLMSFLRIGDVAAGSIQSGGTTRRAAKLICVDLDHPEIEDFINLKVREERKARAMHLGSKYLNEIDGGEIYSDEFEGEAINSVTGQNANDSVRVTDNFLNHMDNNLEWNLTQRTDGKVVKTLFARDLWSQICSAAWNCADPGVQFHDIINSWHTCKNDGQINASNPCCFAAGTLVDTSEGLIDIADLEKACSRGEQLPYAFSFNQKTSLPVLRPIINAWVAGTTKTLVDVYLDTGEVFRCTPEHKWLRRDGYYTEAQNLIPGTSLRKIGRNINTYRSDRCSILHRPTNEIRNGTVYQSRWMWEQVKGKIPVGYEIHHMNDDPTDDRISNFELIKELDHLVHHSTGKNNPRFINVDSKLLVETYDAVIANRKNRTKGQLVTPGIWNAYIRKHHLNGIVPLAQSPTTGGRIQGMTWNEFVKQIELAREQVNAKVVKVVPVKLDEPIEVYDIEVQETHNFGIRANNNRNQPSIIVSNSEYMFLDSTACNLASLNLLTFLSRDGIFDVRAFEYSTRLWTCVLEISVYMASFPSKEIAEGSYNYRTLGLGYANLGGLLFRKNLPYDSDQGRHLAAQITALMHGVSYKTSSDMAYELGPFPRWEANKDSMTDVINKHCMQVGHLISNTPEQDDLRHAIHRVWYSIEPNNGFRNAQVSLLAPTGTISLLMDCETSGIEPYFSPKIIKNLAGGGEMHFENKVPSSECAVGENCLRPMAHVLMVAAVQPFLSGAVSKTVNLPNSATVEDIDEIYRSAHRLGLKAIAVYRDGSKMTQPMNTKNEEPTGGFLMTGKQKEKLKEIFVNITPDVQRAYNEYWSDKNENNEEFGKTIMESDFEDNELQRNPDLQKVYDDNLTEVIGEALEKMKEQYPNDLPQEEQNKEDIFTDKEKLENLIKLMPVTEKLMFENKRVPLPMRRGGYTQKLRVGDQVLYLRTGEYPNGKLGEIFVTLSREGSTVRSLMEAFGKAISLGLQFGVPLQEFVDAFTHTKFEPSGIVQGHDRIKMCSSIIDLIFRDLAVEYLKQDDLAHVKPKAESESEECFPSINSMWESKREEIIKENLIEEEEEIHTPKPGDPFPFTHTLEEQAHVDSELQALLTSEPQSKNTGDLCHVCGNMSVIHVGTCTMCLNCNDNTGCG